MDEVCGDPCIDTPTSWVSKGIFGEQLWLNEREKVPSGYRSVLAWLIAVGGIGFAFMVWGLVSLDVWPSNGRRQR